MEELHVLFSGRVQGVGFRWTVQDTAEQLGLTGFVRNLSNGKVEVVAQGERAQLEHFLEAIERDPGSAQINSLKKEWCIPNGATYRSFDITF